MSLSPSDIRNYEFSAQMRGYDKAEVDNFLEQIAQAFDLVKQENGKLLAVLETLRAQVSTLVQNEDIIKNAAIDARRNANLTINDAKKDAQALLAKAKEEIEKMASLKVKKLKNLEQQIKQIEQSKKEYLGKLRVLVSSHLELVEKESVSELKEEITPSETKDTPAPDVTADKMEKIEESVKYDNSFDIRTTVHGDLVDEPIQVEEREEALADALRKLYQAKKSLPPDLTEQIEGKPEPIPSLASPKKKWMETNARAEEVPPEYIARKKGDDPAPSGRGLADSNSMEPNPMLMEEIEEAKKTPAAKRSSSGRLDVAKEFDEIAARFNEEMNKAEKRK